MGTPAKHIDRNSLGKSEEVCLDSRKAAFRGALSQEGKWAQLAKSEWNDIFFAATKRAMDIVCSLVGLAILLPFFCLVAVLIKFDGPGPVFFVQERWGQAGRRIKVYKFRTMKKAGSDPSGAKQAVDNDPRISKIGHVLRRSNIDELPQLLNVILGDMSLVGPRCHPIHMLAGGVPYEELVPDYFERLAVRPGITGLAQVKGYRGPTLDADLAKMRIHLDLKYIQTHGIIMDIGILFRTLKQELRGGTGS